MSQTDLKSAPVIASKSGRRGLKADEHQKRAPAGANSKLEETREGKPLNFSPPAASPQPATNSSAAPTTKIPEPSLLSVQGTQRTYGKGPTPRPPAPALQPVDLPSSATRPHPVLQSPCKPVPHDQQHALNNTPGKDSATAAAAAAAITPNTEPRVSRCRGSGTALTAQCAA